jgi:hypothetical protein
MISLRLIFCVSKCYLFSFLFVLPAFGDEQIKTQKNVLDNRDTKITCLYNPEIKSWQLMQAVSKHSRLSSIEANENMTYEQLNNMYMLESGCRGFGQSLVKNKRFSWNLATYKTKKFVPLTITNSELFDFD